MDPTNASHAERLEAAGHAARAMLGSDVLAVSPAGIASMEASGFAFMMPEAQPEPYEMDGRVAIVDVSSALYSSSDFWTDFLGLWTYARFGKVQAMIDADERADAAVYRWRCPGGQVLKVGLAANALDDASKPVVNFVDTQMDSAAYWVGCGNPIVASVDAPAGSIGTVYARDDVTIGMAESGIKRTWFTSDAELKIDGVPTNAMTDAEAERHRARAAEFGLKFQQRVSAARGIPVEQIAGYKGESFMNQAAIDAGLVDKIGTLQDAIDMALSMVGDESGDDMDPEDEGAPRQEMEGNTMPAKTLAALALALGAGDITDENDADVAGKIGALAASAQASADLQAKLDMATATIAQKGEEVATLTAQVEALQASLNEHAAAAEEGAWGEALKAAGVKDEYQASVRRHAEGVRKDGQSPADAVAVIKADMLFGAAFKVDAPEAPEGDDAPKAPAIPAPVDSPVASGGVITPSWISARTSNSFD